MKTLEEELREMPDETVLHTKADATGAMRTLIAIATLILWLVLVILGVASIWGQSWQNSYFESATKVLLPLFNATIAASLAYIFGKPIVNALALRLAKRP